MKPRWTLVLQGRAAAWLLHATRMRLFALLGAAGVILGLQLSAPAWVSLFEDRLSSQTWGLADSTDRERRVVVVDIDERSVQELGPWPWPRERIAQVLRQLDRYGVSVKAVDILFEGVQSQDGELARALASGAPSVIAQLFSLQPWPAVHAGFPFDPWPVSSGALPCLAGAWPAAGHVAPSAALQASARSGHMTPIVDADGAVRRVPAVVCHEGRAYGALAISTLAAATGSSPLWVQSDSLFGLERHVEVAGLRLPVNQRGEVHVSYELPRASFVSISASDLLAGQVPPELLRGVIALIGSTAMGAGDAVVTPQGGAVGGVEVHAQLLAAALDARTPRVPAWAAWARFAAAVTAAALILILLRRGHGASVVVPLCATASLLVIFIGHAVLLLKAHSVVHWGLPALFVLSFGALTLAFELARVKLERERLYSNLSSYLPEGAARRIALEPASAQVRAERRVATAMFVDLRNFSAYCEGRDPADTATVLHLFYTTVDRIVRASGGVVEQVVGDSVMAVWNASAPCEDHAARAVGVAEAIWRECLAQLPRTATRKTPPLDVGVGIESGPVLVGSFGPAQRRVHSVLGEPVSVAARLQAMTADLAYPILVGPQAAQACGHPSLRPIGEFLLAGMSQPRCLHALRVNVDAQHLRLVYSVDQDKVIGL